MQFLNYSFIIVPVLIANSIEDLTIDTDYFFIKWYVSFIVALLIQNFSIIASSISFFIEAMIYDWLLLTTFGTVIFFIENC
jgi:hypothetical protein